MALRALARAWPCAHMRACAMPPFVRWQRTVHTRPSPTALDVLRERDLLNDCTSQDMHLALRSLPPVYCGFDPTADTLHLGNLVAIMALIHFRRQGHPVIALVGGATGQIGDPSGRSSERARIDHAQIAANARGIDATLRRMFANAMTFYPPVKGEGARDTDSREEWRAESVEKFRSSFGAAAATEGDPLIAVVNNRTWFAGMGVLDFVGGIGRLFRMGAMLGRESVRLRMESPEGMSYTEFSYQLFQAYDFYHLHKHHGCRVQIGGSDQWGNITAGIDLIRRAAAEHPIPTGASTAESEKEPLAFGVTLPLVTTASGEKFGKSAGNAVWLREDRTSAYELYQFFMRTEDADVEKYLKMFTFLPVDEIRSTVNEHLEAPHKRVGQTTLARCVTRLVHGDEGLSRAVRLTDILFGDSRTKISSLLPEDASALLRLGGVTRIDRRRLSGEGADVKVSTLLTECGLSASRGAARRSVEGGGVYLNNGRMNGDALLTEADVLSEGVVILRMGKANYRVLHVA